MPAQNCCLKANPCQTECKVPEKINDAVAENPVCSHVRFSWTKPTSQKDVRQYQIQVQMANGGFRELPAIPGTYSAYRVSNLHLMTAPYSLLKDAAVKFRIRAWSECGWGEWSDADCSLDAKAADSTSTDDDKIKADASK